ncbi:hypothetical protein [Halobacteriovorax sp. ZH4_bin.1]|uniref:hypothetical protein n=1 Tax=unclassified Halobacteriovorax TaxID=2639665 RepID=UPI003716CB32
MIVMMSKWIFVSMIIFAEVYATVCNSKALNVIYVNGVGNVRRPVLQTNSIKSLYETSDKNLESLFFNGSLISKREAVEFDFVHNRSEGGSILLGVFSDLANDAYYDLKEAQKQINQLSHIIEPVEESFVDKCFAAYLVEDFPCPVYTSESERLMHEEIIKRVSKIKDRINKDQELGGDLNQLKTKLLNNVDNSMNTILIGHSQGALYVDQSYLYTFPYALEYSNDEDSDYVKSRKIAALGVAPPHNSGYQYPNYGYIILDDDILNKYSGSYTSPPPSSHNFVRQDNPSSLFGRALSSFISDPGNFKKNILNTFSPNQLRDNHSFLGLYLNNNVYVKDIFTGEVKSMQKVFLENMSTLANTLPATCDFQIKLKDKDNSGELKDYLTVIDKGDSVEVVLNSEPDLYVDFNELDDLTYTNDKLKKLFNGEESNKVTLAKPLFPSNYSFDLTLEYLYLDEFEYKGRFFASLQLCEGASCCRQSDQVYCDGLCKPKPRDGMSYGENCSGPYYDSTPSCPVTCIPIKGEEANIGCSLVYDDNMENVEYFKPIPGKYFSVSEDSITMTGYCNNSDPSGGLRESEPSCSCSK